MKKSSTRFVVIFLLIAASLGSYLYLQQVSGSMFPEASEESILENRVDPEEEAATPEMVLPDVQLLKNVVETGKRFIPAS